MYVPKVISILSITLLLSACASTPEKIDVTENSEGSGPIQAEKPKADGLTERVLKGTIHTTKSATQKAAGLTVDGAELAVKGTVKGVKAGGNVILGTGKAVVDGTRWVGEKIGGGIRFIVTAPAINDASNPVGNKTLADAALSPLADLNIRKRERPEVIKWLEVNEVYHVEEAVSCEWLEVRIGELDDALGDDFDVEETSSSLLEQVGDAGKGAAVSSVASAVGDHIPGRGMIRSLSGAKARQKRTRELYQRGVARRSYLKGITKSQGC